MLEADQDTHLQTLLRCVCVCEASVRKSGCVCVHARACVCMHVCIKSSVCIGAKTRKVKSASKRLSTGTEKVCCCCCTDLKIDLCGKCLLCSIPRCVCACMGMQQFVEDIKTQGCRTGGGKGD